MSIAFAKNPEQNAVIYFYFFIYERKTSTHKNTSFFVDYFHFILFYENEREEKKMFDKMVDNQGNEDVSKI